MRFSVDTKKLQQQVRDYISLSDLRIGCNRSILFQSVMRYIVCERQAGELRAAFAEARITKAQLSSAANAARMLAGFLQRLQKNPRITIANNPPKIGPRGAMPIPVLNQDLLNTAEWLDNIGPWRPDSTEALVALILHAEQSTGTRQLTAITNLLNSALKAAGLPDTLNDQSLKKRYDRAGDSIHKKAKELLRFWAALD